MKLSKKFSSLFSKAAGFTMIELLIVISILGILSVAVISAINPFEQIARTRDSAKMQDAIKVVGAVERFTTANGYAPWQADETEATLDALATPVLVNASLVDSGSCQLLAKLSDGGEVDPICTYGNKELKPTEVQKINAFTALRGLYIYNRGNLGDSTYVCYEPESEQERNEAAVRCADPTGRPVDIDADVWTALCAGTYTGGDGVPMSCLP